MAITATQVKELREETGAGMMDCKKALEECNGDFAKAKDFLREKGLAKAKSKASRIAAEGLCRFVFEKNIGYLFELNSETDFVAKNKEFTNLLDLIGTTLLKSKAKDTDEALKLVANKKETISDLIAAMTAKIGEKITLRRVTRIEKGAKEFFASYAHQEGRILNVVIMDCDNQEVGRNIGMQVAAGKPQYLNQNEVPSDILKHEKEILTKQVMQEGKPQNVAEKIVEGKIRKFYEEVCLLNQVYIKDTSLKVFQYLANEKVNVLKFYRLEVGEGIEKRKEDFAAEVAAQIK